MIKSFVIFLLSLFLFSVHAAEETTAAVTTCTGNAGGVEKTKNVACVPSPFSCSDFGLSETNSLGGAWPGLCFLPDDNRVAISKSQSTGCPDMTWSRSGSLCVRPICPPGEVRNTLGVCVPQPPTCPPDKVRNSFTGICQYPCVKGKNEGSLDGASGNSHGVKGCSVSCSTEISMGGFWSGSGCKQTGEQAGPDSLNGTNSEDPKPNPPTPSSCLSGGDGFITGSTGTTTCVPASKAPENVVTVKKGVRTVQNPDGTKSEEETSTTTTDGPGGPTVTTTKTTKDPADPTKPPVIKTETADKGSYCEANPAAAICKQTSECKDNPDRSGCKDLGTPSAEDALTSTASGPGIIMPIGFGSSAACPSDISLPRGASFSFKWSCDFASALRPVLLAVAWLTASLIVVGAFKGQ